MRCYILITFFLSLYAFYQLRIIKARGLIERVSDGILFRDSDVIDNNTYFVDMNSIKSSLTRIYKKRTKGASTKGGLPVDVVAKVHSELQRIANQSLSNYVKAKCKGNAYDYDCKYIVSVRNLLEKKDFAKLQQGFESLKRFSDGKVCDGCLKNRSATLKLSPRDQKGVIRKFVGGEETFDVFNITNQYYPPPGTKYDVTAIFALYGRNRLFTLQELLYRFGGNIMVVIKASIGEEATFLEFIESHYLPPRMTIILYLVNDAHPQYRHFPINYLRSLGISNVKTTHYIVLDIDAHLSENSYYELTHLPDFIYERNNTAAILPVFFFNKLMEYCNSIQSCAYLSSAIQPKNKHELMLCIHSGICSSDKNIRTHYYVMPEWYFTRCRVSRIKCLITDMMEPYVMVKHTPHSTMYDSRFEDYGYNKVSYFEELRERNFEMYILGNAFAMDYPHPVTAFRKIYLSGMGVTGAHAVFKVFMNELHAKYSRQKPFPVCREPLQNYYDDVC